MTARHMRNVALCRAYTVGDATVDDVERVYLSGGEWEIHAPVGIAFTEDEVLILAGLVGLSAGHLGDGLTPEERSVIDTVYAAADDIESKEKDA